MVCGVDNEFHNDTFELNALKTYIDLVSTTSNTLVLKLTQKNTTTISLASFYK